MLTCEVEGFELITGVVGAQAVSVWHKHFHHNDSQNGERNSGESYIQ